MTYIRKLQPSVLGSAYITHLALVGVIVASPRPALDEGLHVQRNWVLERLLHLHSLQRLKVKLEPVEAKRDQSQNHFTGTQHLTIFSSSTATSHDLQQ